MQREREKRTFLGWIRRLVFVLPVWRKLSMVAASCQMLFGEPAASANLRAQPTRDILLPGKRSSGSDFLL